MSTSIVEEIEVHACACVIWWNLPINMVSWAQSRGKARRRCTFVMMFEEEGQDGIGVGGREEEY